MPFIFVDHVAGLVCSDFLYVDAIALEDLNHLPYAGDVLRGARLEPTDAEAKFVTSKGSWFLLRDANRLWGRAGGQFVQFVGVGARDALPLLRLRCCLKDSLLNVTILVFAANDEADVFAFF